ncbi:response regulator [Treponema sp. JC4]|uniref:response regulator transcription factor n=1 Tax=Treponema sp. JC4 TaxID=1124982 RepID=UPI00025B0482|nr:response regulator transcription factor [Treponema sp. JC4]EID85888.1 response regulator [Treponema sp. JC4]
MEKSLFIVDDHNMLLKGLENYLLENTDWKVSGTFTSAPACLSALETISLQEDFPKIIIVDVQLGKESGFELVEKITKSRPDIKCLIYSMYDTPGYILQAKESGAKGYISKVASEEELLLALETLYQGGEYIEKRMEGVQKKLSGLDSLFSRQEKVIFEKLLQGKSNRQIADELFISSHSVENYVSFIYDKTNVKNRRELIEKFQ